MLICNKIVSRHFFQSIGAALLITGQAIAQSTASPSVTHLDFDRPEARALKYFTSTTLMSGLPPPEAVEGDRRLGSVTLGLEAGWIPELNAERARVGFTGRKVEDLNKAPILIRPSLRVGLPWKFSLVVAGPPPITVFGVTPRLLALGVERPILRREGWTLGWRGSGQAGWVKGAFTCPKRSLGFPAGSPENPAGCVGESADKAWLRYVGTEIQYTQRIPRVPKLTPHLALGVNFIDSKFQVNAPRGTGIDRSELWTHGVTYSGTAGFSYMLTSRAAFSVDAFYTPLLVRRDRAGPRTNDGLFNVRALLSYTLR